MLPVVRPPGPAMVPLHRCPLSASFRRGSLDYSGTADHVKSISSLHGGEQVQRRTYNPLNIIRDRHRGAKGGAYDFERT
jgi:hypothetical protein